MHKYPIFVHSDKNINTIIFPFEIMNIRKCGEKDYLKEDHLSYTAISRKVVGKSARDNPERHCGRF